MDRKYEPIKIYYAFSLGLMFLMFLSQLVVVLINCLKKWTSLFDSLKGIIINTIESNKIFVFDLPSMLVVRSIVLILMLVSFIITLVPFLKNDSKKRNFTFQIISGIFGVVFLVFDVFIKYKDEFFNNLMIKTPYLYGAYLSYIAYCTIIALMIVISQKYNRKSNQV